MEQVGAKHYDWDVNGNLEQASTELSDGSFVTNALYTHDWRDRLVGVDQGESNTELIVDPLGRIAKVHMGVLSRPELEDALEEISSAMPHGAGA